MSSGPRAVAERGAIELQYVKSFAGWSPRYVPEALLREAATRLQDRFLFGSDYPFITPQRWLKDFEAVKIEFKPEVKEKLFWKNGQKLLAHTAVGHMHFSS
jgi:predicted TIM-barrel fold metal-dependent hydrolase